MADPFFYADGKYLRSRRTGEIVEATAEQTSRYQAERKKTSEMSRGDVRAAFEECRDGWARHARRRVSPGPYGTERMWESKWQFAKDYALEHGLDADALAERMVDEGLLRSNEDGDVRPEGV